MLNSKAPMLIRVMRDPETSEEFEVPFLNHRRFASFKFKDASETVLPIALLLTRDDARLTSDHNDRLVSHGSTSARLRQPPGDLLLIFKSLGHWIRPELPSVRTDFISTSIQNYSKLMNILSCRHSQTIHDGV